MGFEEEGDVGQDREIVHFADPFRGATADDIAGEGGEDVAVAQHEVAGLEQGEQLALVAIGEIGGVNEAEGGRGQEIHLLALAGGAFHQFGGIPLGKEHLELLHLHPAFEQIDLRGLAGTIESFDSDQSPGQSQFGDGLLHGLQTTVEGGICL